VTDADAAEALAALGHPARLAVFRLLVRAGEAGLAVGDLVRLAEVPASTLAHHLGALVAAGLVSQEADGRRTVNRAVYPRMRETLAYVAAECCAGVRLADDAA
jgi:DNA-binding transcriptional ArsR family regulator